MREKGVDGSFARRYNSLLGRADHCFKAGESNFSPPIFECMKPLFRSETGRVGGVGLKLHPDYKYANLYHWLLGDSHFVRGGSGTPLPMKNRPYSDDSGEAGLD